MALLMPNSVFIHVPKTGGTWVRAAGHWISSCFSDSFPKFVERYLETCPGIATETMLRMLGWAPDRNTWQPTPFAVSFVGRSITLQEDLVTALTRAGESFNEDAIAGVSPRRVAASGEFRKACGLSASLKQKITDAESTLCNLFGYE